MRMWWSLYCLLRHARKHGLRVVFVELGNDVVSKEVHGSIYKNKLEKVDVGHKR